ncbi:hypothetical protein, partial [Steroidobacter cummioxidans]|uniref:hypothetical protein n=1 Tax=Steroidobacter cummioxidans TaxID=1803913 RepID=UPI0019D4DBE1
QRQMCIRDRSTSASADPAASSSGASAPAPLPEVIADRFEIRGKLEGDQVTFWLETDLPDNVPVMTDVNREYVGRNSEGSETYAPMYWAEKLTVGALRNPRTVTIDDTKWVQHVEEALNLSAAVADNPVTIVSINQSVTVSLTVPLVGHVPPLEPEASNLIGKAVVVDDGWHRVEGEVAFPHKLSVPVKTETDWVNPQKLQVGQRYRLSGNANVLPEFESADPLVDIVNMTRVPAGTIIEIRRIDDSGHSRRYLVRAQGDSAAVGGWISVNNLLAQTLERVK